MFILAIDPSINNVGFATLQTYEKKSISPKWAGGTYHPDKEIDVMEKAQAAFTFIYKTIKRPDHPIPDQLIVEYPQFMGGIKGAVASQQGYTLDLAAICGFFAGAFAIPTYLYTPSQWKGTKPKSATEAAYKRLISKTLPSEHEQDATLLLHFHATKYKYL